MAEITAQMVKELREMTSAGMMDCKRALTESDGDIERAVETLRKKGLKDVTKRAGKVAAEGCVFSYIHAGGRIGVMIELNSETDFVARGDDFNELARSVAMHIAWANPPYLSREDVPSGVLESERDIFREQLKPGQEKVADKIISGKLEKFYSENVLLEQLDARDTGAKKTIESLVNELSSKVGEKIVLRRFLRYEVGEGIEVRSENFAQEVAAITAS